MIDRVRRLIRHRSSRTGRYVSAREASANRDTTVSEAHPFRALPISVERAAVLCVQRNGVEGTLERLQD